MLSLPAILLVCRLVAPPDVLAAIVQVESGGDELALAVNGPVELARRPRDLGEARAMARWLLDHGYNFDAGLAQVNSANFARLGLDANSVLEPCANLRAAATVLRECLERAEMVGLAGSPAVRAAFSCYNTGDLSRGIRNGYAGAVLAALRRSVSSRRAPTFQVVIPASFPEDARRPDVFALAVAGPTRPSVERSPRSPQ